VLIPEDNTKDLVDINETIKSGLEIIPVSRMDEVLAAALTKKPEPIEWDEEAAAKAEKPPVPGVPEEDEPGIVAH